jgi:hypothetical protein
MKLKHFLCLMLLAMAACDRVTAERIETWKNTQKGPLKIEEALQNPGLTPNLRALAAAALVDLGKPEKVDEVMVLLPETERSEILKTLIDLYIRGMQSDKVPKVRDARDALFSVRGYAPADVKKKIDQALLVNIEKDLQNWRFSGGRHSLEKILSTIGSDAAPVLVKLFADPEAPYKGLAELAVKVCDPASLEAAGGAFLQRIQKGVPMPPDMWNSLGILGGNTIAEFLETKLLKGTTEETILAARALQQSRFPTLLPLAIQIAASAKSKRELRDEMFGVIEVIGGPEAEKGLLQIIAEDKEDLVRYRAHEALLEIGKEKVIVQALEAFPTKATYLRQDVLDFLVKDIGKLGPKSKPQVLNALNSPAPLARMTAVLALGSPLPMNPKAFLGEAADARIVAKLAVDKATIKGFPSGITVGTEAQRVAGLLQGKGL